MGFRLRTLRIALAALALVSSVVLAPDAHARHRAKLGIGSCDGPDSTRATPGSSTTVSACFTDEGQPLGAHRVLFVMDGPVTTRSVEGTTDSQGVVSVPVVSERPGRTRVAVCDQDMCISPITVLFAPAGADLPDDPPEPPSITSGDSTQPLRPVTSALPVPPAAEGFACSSGPGVDPIEIPAFASIGSFSTSRLAHPRGTGATDAIQVVTGQNLTAGAAIYSVPSSVFVTLAARDSPVDPTGPFPLRGSNRVMVFFTLGDSRFGKNELAFEDGAWRSVSPSFTVALEHSTVTFYSDRGAFPRGRSAAGTRIEGRCDGSGFSVLAEPDTSGGTGPEAPVGRASPLTVAIGVALLLLLAALAFAVVRSSRPPSGGGLLEAASGPPVFVRREELSYDSVGRLRGYTEVVELPGGSKRTIKGRVVQEDLVVDPPLLLDSSDWDDEVIETRRDRMRYDSGGSLLSYDEENISPDGTTQRSTVGNIVFDRYQRVVRFQRTTATGLGTKRSETVVLEHDHLPEDTPPAQPVSLAPHERMERRDLRFDEEDHVSAYSAIVIGSSAEPVLTGSRAAGPVPVPRPLFECGLAWPKVPWFQSYQNQGMGRARDLFTRWFRRHACRIEIRSSSDARIAVAGQPLPKTNGSRTLWAFAEGDYAVSIDDRLAGWIAVRHIPGRVEADLG